VPPSLPPCHHLPHRYHTTIYTTILPFFLTTQEVHILLTTFTSCDVRYWVQEAGATSPGGGGEAALLLPGGKNGVVATACLHLCWVTCTALPVPFLHHDAILPATTWSPDFPPHSHHCSWVHSPAYRPRLLRDSTTASWRRYLSSGKEEVFLFSGVPYTFLHLLPTLLPLTSLPAYQCAWWSLGWGGLSLCISLSASSCSLTTASLYTHATILPTCHSAGGRWEGLHSLTTHLFCLF